MTWTKVEKQRMKTARFKTVIEKSGTPDQYLPWTDPVTDPKFLKAVREQRVMTVRRRNVGTRKDSAEVGFHKGKERSFLVFPRSLGPFVGARVVGIDYDSVREPRTQSHGVAPKTKKPRHDRAPGVRPAISKRPPVSKPLPVSKRFRVHVEVRAKHHVGVDVEAASVTEAKARALQQLMQQPVTFPREALRMKARVRAA